MSGRLKVRLSVLPGEPLDGSGRVCIHFFVKDETALHSEPHVLHPVYGEDGAQKKQDGRVGPARGRLACNPRKSPAIVKRGGVIIVTQRTDEPSAVTCRQCMASEEYISAVNKYRELTGAAN